MHTTSFDPHTLPSLRVSTRARVDLGFDDALAIVAGLCRTPFGRESINDDVFPTDVGDLEHRLRCAVEARGCVERKVQPDFGGVREIRHIIEASGKGIVLAAADIVDVAKTIDALGRLKDVVVFQGDEAPALVVLGEQLDDERRFSRRVLRSFDEQGGLVDEASPELATRRARVRQLRAEAQEKLQALVRDYDELEVLRDRNFTIRNDRYVLPVKSEYQGKVDGIVHDASQTHQTVFIEPRALMQLGNRIKIARAEVIEEEQRIFQEMSSEIAELAARLAIDLRTAGSIEGAFARGAFAHGIGGEEIVVNAAAPTLSLRRARHPLLAWLRFQAQQQEKLASAVTPNDLRLDGARCLVISGPNAGGKTVALKTAGLISLLARAGFPVPVDVGSVIPAFAGVSVSIGDEQNLQGGFSSFSGHLSAVKGIVDDVKEDAQRGCTLVLLDELMSGTDPAQGAALAQALLEDIVDTHVDRVSVIVTTHYDRLKALALAELQAPTAAGSSRRFRNASVQTDRFGKPTFVLVLDEVGTSNAFDAARRFGVAEGIIERALALLAPEQKELHALLRALAEQKQALAGRVEAAESERTRFADETARLERRLVELDAERARLRKEGKRAFLDEITAARATVKDAIAATLTKDSRALNVASQNLKKLEEDTRAEVAPTKQELTSSLLAPEHVKIGDTIELATMPGVRMTVQEFDGDDVIVARGAMRTRVARGQLRTPEVEKVDTKLRTLKGSKKTAAPSTGPDPRTGDTTLDLRGQRADDAVELLDAFLDKLLRDNRQTGYVLHGHGGGALKKVVREYLNRSRYVKGHGPGSIDDGGDSWTVVDLNDNARV
jgi:DNA mismatch repair protein MutS2